MGCEATKANQGLCWFEGLSLSRVLYSGLVAQYGATSYVSFGGDSSFVNLLNSIQVALLVLFFRLRLGAFGSESCSYPLSLERPCMRKVWQGMMTTSVSVGTFYGREMNTSKEFEGSRFVRSRDLKITTDWFRSWPRAHLCTAEGVYIFGDLIISGFRLLIRISTTSRSSPERSRAMSR